jgi:murein peptide amidase A
MKGRIMVLAGIAAAAGVCLIAIARTLPGAGADTPGGGARASSGAPRKDGFLAFAETPRRPGNLLERVGIAGRSSAGRPIRLRQFGDPALPGELLVFGCIHGDECVGRRVRPIAFGCPDPHADIYLVPDLNPDGLDLGSRLNGRGVDLNRNFPAGWRPGGRRGDPEYSGPRPLSEPESRLAARIVRRLRPRVTIWLHQHHGGALIRAWGPSVSDARRFARSAGLRFRRLPWPGGTAPNWQNHSFPGASSFVVELPRGPLATGVKVRIERAIGLLGRKVGKD